MAKSSFSSECRKAAWSESEGESQQVLATLTIVKRTGEVLGRFEDVVQHVQDVLALLLGLSGEDSDWASADSQVRDMDGVDVPFAARDLELLVWAVVVMSVTVLLDASTALENAHLLLRSAVEESVVPLRELVFVAVKD